MCGEDDFSWGITHHGQGQRRPVEGWESSEHQVHGGYEALNVMVPGRGLERPGVRMRQSLEVGWGILPLAGYLTTGGSGQHPAEQRSPPCL